jgi:hypothetical protein
MLRKAAQDAVDETLVNVFRVFWWIERGDLLMAEHYHHTAQAEACTALDWALRVQRERSK